MAYFLLIYDRSAGKLIRQKQFNSGADALDARFVAEAEYGIQSNIEVVAISAASETELRKTHGRYFLSDDELRERLVEAVR